jgi:hypothetical protein
MKKMLALLAIAALAIGATGCKKEQGTAEGAASAIGKAADDAAADAKATATDAKDAADKKASEATK